MTQTLPDITLPAFKETIDQFFAEPHTLSLGINQGFAYAAQTYTAGINGSLTGISINVRSRRALNPASNFYRLHVALCAVRDGYPGALLTELLLETDEAQIDTIIRFPDTVPQTAGTQYAIVVHYADAPPAAAGKALGNWYGANGDPYPPGELCTGPDGKIWFISSLNNFDVHFRTYVTPA